MEVGIKETQELLDGLGKVALLAKKINADGKINADDLQHLMAAAAEVDVLAEAVKGVDQVPEELGDLDKDEVLAIIQKIYSISDEINAV